MTFLFDHISTERIEFFVLFQLDFDRINFAVDLFFGLLVLSRVFGLLLDPRAGIEGNVAFAHDGTAALRMHISDYGRRLIVEKVSAEAQARHEGAAAL